MNPSETTEPYHHAKAHMPSLGWRPEDDLARLFWERQVDRDGGEDSSNVKLLVAFHNTWIRWIQWRGASPEEAVEGARLGMRAVITHEVSNPDEAERQGELIDEFSLCYLE